MARFNPASSPGAYNQVIGHVDKTSRLQQGQQKDRNDQVNNNKQLADTHRTYAKSFDFGIKVEGQSRENALQFEDYFRKIDQTLQMKAFEQAYQSSIRNSNQRVEQVNRDTEQTVNFVNNVLDTGFNIYKQREQAIEKSQYNALENIRLTQGTSIQDYHTIQSIERGILDDENTTDSRVQAFKDRGYTVEQLRTIAGARQGVFELSLLNQVRSEVGLAHHTMFQTGIQVRGQPEGTTAQTLLDQGDVPGVMQAYNQHVQGILRMAQGANGGNPLNMDALSKDIDRGRASVMSAVSKVHQTQTASKLESERLNNTSNLVLARGAQGIADRFNQHPNLIGQTWEDLKTLAQVEGSGVTSTFLSDLRQKINPHTGRTYEQDYRVELDAVNDAINKERSTQERVDNLNRNDIKDNYLTQIYQDRRDGKVYTAEGGAKLIENARDAGLRESEVNEIAKAVNANMADTAPATQEADIEWANTVKNNPHLIGWTESKIWEVAPTKKWAQKKITEMHTRQGRDDDLKSAEGTIETELKTRLGEQIKDRYGSATFYAAYDAALEDYKTRRAALGKNGHAEALKLFADDLGKDKHAGRYAVPDVSKDTETIGFNNFQLSAADINTEPKTHKSLSADLDKAAVKPSLVSSRLAAIGDIDTAYLTTEELKHFAGNHGNINAPDDPEMWRKMQNIRDAIGGNTTTMDVATAILEARGEEVRTYEVDTSVADQAIRDIEERLGKDVARQFANGTATVKGQVNFSPSNVSSITRENDSGQPGLDVFLEDKKAGAVLPGVVKYIGNQLNADGSGYGNYAVIESTNPLNGQKVDVLYAHAADGSMRVRVGDTVSYGTHIFTQGGTGSVSSYDGTIFSIDLFRAGPAGTTDLTPAAGWKDLREHIINNLRGGNQQQQPQQQTRDVSADNVLALEKARQMSGETTAEEFNQTREAIEGKSSANEDDPEISGQVMETRGGIKYWWAGNPPELYSKVPGGEPEKKPAHYFELYAGDTE